MRPIIGVLLAAVLAFPAPVWAAGNIRVGPKTGHGIPSLPHATIPGPGALSIPGLTDISIPSFGPAAEAPTTALEYLNAEVPFEIPQTGDLDGEKSHADKTFEFKLGAKSPTEGGAAIPSGDAGAAGDGSPGDSAADDGGGDGYPSRTVKFRGQLFRSTLFRPNTPIEPEIIRALGAAKKSIHLALYEFKLTGVLDALREARARGVEIHLVLDYSNVFPRQDPGSDYKPRRSREVWALLREGFDVKVLRGLSDYGINHNKFAVIDAGESQSMAIFGSYNWAWTAEHSHYENANFTVEKRRLEALKTYWDWLDSMAKPERQARDFQWPAAVPPPPVAIAANIAFNAIKLPAIVLSPTLVPGQSIEDRIAAAMDASLQTVDVSIFALRSTKIAEAIVRAKDRGLKVRVIIDESQSDSVPFGPYTRWLTAQGVEVRLLAGPDPNSTFPLAQKSHHKLAIFDGKLVQTGSANYTKYAAAANYENAHFIKDATDVAAYQWVYDRMFARAKPLTATGPAPALPTDAELLEESGHLPGPLPPLPPHPQPDPSLKARPVVFKDITLPSYAFRPDTPVEALIVKAIDSAKKSVRLALYEFNLDATMAAVRRAKKRGLKIEIVVDRSHVYTSGKDHTGRPRKPSPEIQALIAEGFDILTLKGEKSGIMHNKYMLLDAEDGGIVMWGSYNFADTAEFNHYENVMFSDEPHRVAAYLAYFEYKRELASAIDQDKLDTILTRGLETEDEVSPNRMSHEERDSKFDPPPQVSGPEIDLNGEKFQTQYFSPQGGILDAWVRAILAADKSVEIAMFGFYAREVADALVQAVLQAREDGKELKVRLALDAGQSSLARFDGTPVAQWFAQNGFDVHMVAGPNDDGDPMFEKQHNKFLLIDDKFLMTGSFNLSPTAENNSFENENVVVDPTDVAGFVDFFLRIYRRGWVPRGAAPAPALDATFTLHGL